MIGNIIEIDIWKDWFLINVVIKFGWMKMNIDGDIDMSYHVNIWKYFHWKFFICAKIARF